MGKSRWYTGGACIAMALAYASSANAQTSPANDEAQTPASEEIIVTGQKRSENVQDVPKTVDVVNQNQLTQAGVSTIQDLSRISPAIQGSGGLSSAPAIRGVASFSFAIGVQSQTGVVLDDVPQPSFSTLADDLSDVERVEVFAGPQSTLSGRNAAGGLINIVTHEPTRSFTGSYRFEQTSDSQTRAAGYVSGPISDTLGFSLSAFHNQWDGQLRNLSEHGRPINQFDRNGVRGKLRWNPADNIDVTLTGFYTRTNASTNAILSGGPFVAADASLIPTLELLHPGISVEPFTHDVNVPGHGTAIYKNRGGSLRINVDTAVGTLSSISSYSKSNQVRDDLTVGYEIAGNAIRQQTDIDVDYTTQEVRLASSDQSSKLQYLLGAIYSNTDTFQPFTRAILFPADWDRSSLVRSIAAYGRATYEFLPATRLTLGGRYQHDLLRYRWAFLDGSAATSAGSTNYDFVTGEASLQHDFTSNVKGYLTYANGQTGRVYDTEDVASAMSTAGLQPLKSQYFEHFEGGFKTQLLDRRLTLNVSAFRTTYKNYQVQAADLSDPSQAASIRLLAVGKVRTQGVDVESSYAVSRNFNLGLSAEYLDAKILDYPGANCFPGQTEAQGCVDGKQNARGPLPGTSKFRLIGSANLTLPFSSLPFDGTLGAFVRYQTRTQFNIEGDARAAQGAYGIVNLTAGIKDHSGKYSAEIFVNNVGNKHFYSAMSTDALLLPATALIGGYARDSFRYWGGRFSLNF